MIKMVEDVGAWTCLLLPGNPGSGNKSLEATIYIQQPQLKMEINPKGNIIYCTDSLIF